MTHLARRSLAGELLPAVEVWERGDVVMDAAGSLWWRANPDGVAAGWPWGYIDGYSPPDPRWPEHIPAPEGAVEEECPVRPLRLLISRGKPATDR